MAVRKACPAAMVVAVVLAELPVATPVVVVAAAVVQEPVAWLLWSGEMVYARIHGKTVVEILQPVPGYTLEQCYHRDLLALCIKVSEEVRPGWVQQEDGTFAPSEAPVAEPVEDAAPEEPTDGA